MWIYFHKAVGASGHKWTEVLRGPSSEFYCNKADQGFQFAAGNAIICHLRTPQHLRAGPTVAELCDGNSSVSSGKSFRLWNANIQMMTDGAWKEGPFNNSLFPSALPSSVKESFEYGGYRTPTWSRDVCVQIPLPGMLQDKAKISQKWIPRSVSDDKTHPWLQRRSQSPHFRYTVWLTFWGTVILCIWKYFCLENWQLQLLPRKLHTTYEPKSHFPLSVGSDRKYAGIEWNRVVSSPGKREKLNQILISGTYKFYELRQVILTSLPSIFTHLQTEVNSI